MAPRSFDAAVGKVQPFGTLPDGSPVQLHTLRSDTLAASVATYGARLVALEAPDRHGVPGDIVLGCDTLEGYLRDQDYLGATVGRYANRIAGGRFVLDGVEYLVAQNQGRNCLHGGRQGFDRRLWRATRAGQRLTLLYSSPAGEEGFPGTLDVAVSYAVDGGELRIDYAAQAGAATPVNLTNHSYFNLTCDPRRTILGHQVTLFADAYCPVDDELLPTGELRDVRGTAFDFSRPSGLDTRIDSTDPQLVAAGGYDHNWVLRPPAGSLRCAAEVYEPRTGRVLQVFTDQPGLQFYTGNQLGGRPGKGGIANARRGGLCLETQHFPDSPNHPAFPSTVLEAGAVYRSSTVLRCSTR